MTPLLLFAAIVKLTVEGPITPVIAEYLTNGIERANEEGASLVVIGLDTPGGLDDAMRSVVKAEMASEVPICVYVSPTGARSASAGVFITAAAHVAAMAPGTNIGAAHPVNIGGEMDSIMKEKVTNDATSYLEGILGERGRNVVWADSFVRFSKSLTAEQALEAGVIDIVAEDLKTLLDRFNSLPDGRTVAISEAEEVIERPMSFRDNLLQLLANPNVAYILMMLGIYGLIFELSHPGGIFPGVTGAISLLLALYSFQTLPVNYAGLALIILGTGLLIAEVKIASNGVLGVGGVAGMLFGSLMLFRADQPFLRVSWLNILVVVGAVVLLFFFIIGKALTAQTRKPATGAEGLVGMRGEARSDISPGAAGTVHIHGELWKAFCDEPVPAGETVEVVSVDGLVIRVKRRSS